jgi:conjugal transfer pilus assembly protein TraI
VNCPWLLVREVLRLNQPEASDGWLTQDALWLVSKTVCDRLRAHLLSQGIGGVPDRNAAVFDVLQEHGIAQATPDGKAIWRATVTSDTGWTHTFTFLRLAPSVIWDVNERPAPFAGKIRVEPGATAAFDAADAAANPTPPTIDLPAFAATDSPRNAAEVPNAIGTRLSLIDQMPASTDSPAAPPMASAARPPRPTAPVADDCAPDENSAQAGISHEDSAGEYFLQWLRDGVRSHRLIINDAKALLHTVAGTAFLVSPGLFQRYAREHPEIARIAGPKDGGDWQWVQKEFERLRLHKRQHDGRNIWTCEVAGPRRRRLLHGYLLNKSHALLDGVLPDNPFLRLLTEVSTTDSDAA